MKRVLFVALSVVAVGASACSSASPVEPSAARHSGGYSVGGNMVESDSSSARSGGYSVGGN